LAGFFSPVPLGIGVDIAAQRQSVSIGQFIAAFPSLAIRKFKKSRFFKYFKQIFNR
jgi:hypothetical protein